MIFIFYWNLPLISRCCCFDNAMWQMCTKGTTDKQTNTQKYLKITHLSPKPPKYRPPRPPPPRNLRVGTYFKISKNLDLCFILKMSNLEWWNYIDFWVMPPSRTMHLNYSLFPFTFITLLSLLTLLSHFLPSYNESFWLT